MSATLPKVLPGNLVAVPFQGLTSGSRLIVNGEMS